VCVCVCVCVCVYVCVLGMEPTASCMHPTTVKSLTAF
jgi:hypothetical protein